MMLVENTVEAAMIMPVNTKEVIKKLLEEIDFILSYDKAREEIDRYWNQIKANSFYDHAKKSFYYDSIYRTSKVLDNHRDSKAFWYLYKKKKKFIDNYIAVSKNNISLEDIKSYSKKFKTIRDKYICHLDQQSISNPDEIFTAANIRPGPFKIFFKQFIKLLLYIYETEYKTSYKPNRYDAKDLKKALYETFPP